MSKLKNVYWLLIKSKADKYFMVIPKITKYVEYAEHFKNKVCEFIKSMIKFPMA